MPTLRSEPDTSDAIEGVDKVAHRPALDHQESRKMRASSSHTSTSHETSRHRDDPADIVYQLAQNSDDEGAGPDATNLPEQANWQRQQEGHSNTGHSTAETPIIPSTSAPTGRIESTMEELSSVQGFSSTGESAAASFIAPQSPEDAEKQIGNPVPPAIAKVLATALATDEPTIPSSQSSPVLIPCERISEPYADGTKAGHTSVIADRNGSTNYPPSETASNNVDSLRSEPLIQVYPSSIYESQPGTNLYEPMEDNASDSDENESVFSQASLASTATSMGIVLASTNDLITNLTSDLLCIEEMSAINLTALKDHSIGRERYRRNVRRLIKALGQDLRAEAQGPMQMATARALQTRRISTHAAHELVARSEALFTERDAMADMEPGQSSREKGQREYVEPKEHETRNDASVDSADEEEDDEQ